MLAGLTYLGEHTTAGGWSGRGPDVDPRRILPHGHLLWPLPALILPWDTWVAPPAPSLPWHLEVPALQGSAVTFHAKC